MDVPDSTHGISYRGYGSFSGQESSPGHYLTPYGVATYIPYFALYLDTTSVSMLLFDGATSLVSFRSECATRLSMFGENDGSTVMVAVLLL